MFLTVSETYINCSSNIIKTYSISGKWLIKSVSNVFNMPTIENPIINEIYKAINMEMFLRFDTLKDYILNLDFLLSSRKLLTVSFVS